MGSLIFCSGFSAFLKGGKVKRLEEGGHLRLKATAAEEGEGGGGGEGQSEEVEEAEETVESDPGSAECNNNKLSL
jgi:hypothetical protein